MKFYDYIRSFNNECNVRLKNNKEERARIERDLAQVSRELKSMDKFFHKPMPLALTGGLMGGSGMGLLAALAFQTPLWIPLLVITILFTILGLVNESFAKHQEEDRIFLNQELRELHRELGAIQNEKAHLLSLVNNISQCFDYYKYLVDENQKDLPINMRLQAVFNSKCMLSTFLHKYYNGELQEFLNLTEYEKLRQEAHLRLNDKIFNAKREESDIVEFTPRRRRRRSDVYYNLPPEEVFTFRRA